MLSVGTIVNSKYEITGMIGHGGMSYVYSAVDIATRAPLAVKEAIRNAHVDEQTMELSLVTEGRLLKGLRNEHLPRIYEVIEQASQILIVMDYVSGTSLDKLLAERGVIPPDTVTKWGIQLCDVFYYLHTQDPPIIYRDMKPGNVICQPNGNLVLIDFGTARTWKSNVYRDSDTVLFGTEGFAAPEQFGGYGQSDARTDIFCLGATLFNLVTGHSPYLKPYGITPLGDWDPALADIPLDQIIRKCTARDPDERFQTDLELKDALIASQNYSGKGGLLKFFSGSKKDETQWQAPVMRVADGRSQLLPNIGVQGRRHEGLSERLRSRSSKTEQGVASDTARADSPGAAYGQSDNNKSPGRGQGTAMYYTQYEENRAYGAQAESQEASYAAVNWRLISILAMVIGVAFFACGSVVMAGFGSLAAGAVLITLGILLLAAGVYAALRNLKE